MHHITIYQCTGLANISPGSSAPCFGEVASINPLEECIGTSSLGGWAVGGGVSLHDNRSVILVAACEHDNTTKLIRKNQ